MRRGSIASRAAKGMLILTVGLAPLTTNAQATGTVLTPAALQSLIPATVFYDGQTTTTQLRNSWGVKFADGSYVLAALVDTSGYSSAVQANFQAYFITEVPIRVNGMKLGAGIYGIGFVSGGKFVVTDVGGHKLLTVDSANDGSLKRPRPLEVVAEPGGKFHLYEGRSYVVLGR